MSQITSLPKEMLCSAFYHLPMKTNVQNRRVCKLWNECCSVVVKAQFIRSNEADLKAKSATFLKIVDGKFEEYFPLFKNLWVDRNEKSINEIVEIFNLKVTKIKMFLCDAIRIDQADANIPQDKKDHFAGRVFVQFIINYKDQKLLHNEYDADDEEAILFNPEEITYYPIELFNLTAKNQELIGEISKGRYCFPIKGKIFELIICRSAVGLDCPALYDGVNRRKISESQVQDPDEFYIPQFDAKNPLKRKNAE